MKKILLILLVFNVTNSFGQTFKIGLEPFDELKIARGIEATLVHSNEKELTFEVKGINRSDVIIEQSRGMLTIKVKTRGLWESMQELEWFVKVKIPYQHLSLIDVSTGAKVASESVIKSEDLLIEADMGGVVEIEVFTKRISIDISMGAVSKIKGETETANIDAKMGAVVKGFDLVVTKYARVEASMGAIVKVYTSKEFDGNASMGGEITVKGNPEITYENESMGGYIDIN